jgi:hypothetical protein
VPARRAQAESFCLPVPASLLPHGLAYGQCLTKRSSGTVVSVIRRGYDQSQNLRPRLVEAPGELTATPQPPWGDHAAPSRPSMRPSTPPSGAERRDAAEIWEGGRYM